eukprot:187882_1
MQYWSYQFIATDKKGNKCSVHAINHGVEDSEMEKLMKSVYYKDCIIYIRYLPFIYDEDTKIQVITTYSYEVEHGTLGCIGCQWIIFITLVSPLIFQWFLVEWEHGIIGIAISVVLLLMLYLINKFCCKQEIELIRIDVDICSDDEYNIFQKQMEGNKDIKCEECNNIMKLVNIEKAYGKDMGAKCNKCDISGLELEGYALFYHCTLEECTTDYCQKCTFGMST